MKIDIQKCSLAIVAVCSWGFSYADGITVGTWFDNVVGCEFSINQIKDKYHGTLKNCKLKPSQPEFKTEEFKRVGKSKFYRLVASSWHYQVSASGDLEVRDDVGIVRKMPALGIAKNSASPKKTKKFEEIVTGATRTEVVNSLGQPLRTTTTRTKSGNLTETLEYRKGYIFIRDGLVFYSAAK